MGPLKGYSCSDGEKVDGRRSPRKILTWAMCSGCHDIHLIQVITWDHYSSGLASSESWRPTQRSQDSGITSTISPISHIYEEGRNAQSIRTPLPQDLQWGNREVTQLMLLPSWLQHTNKQISILSAWCSMKHAGGVGRTETDCVLLQLGQMPL